MKHQYKFHYVYITENVLNGKKYIGDRSSNIPPELDPYRGSGLYLKKSIIKYGKPHFKKKILQVFNSKQEAFDAQEKYINEYNTLVPYGYNISPKGGHQSQNGWNDSAKNKLSNLYKGKSLNERYGLDKSNKIKNKISESKRGKKLNYAVWNKGVEWTDGTKEKMSQSAKKRLADPENHWAFGRKFSLEHKNKLSDSHKGIKLSEDQKKKIGKEVSGSKNGMFRISLLDKWIQKYGEDIAQEKWIEYKEKLSKNSRWKNNIIDGNKHSKEICSN